MIKDKIAIVTGSGRGIGAATALKLAAAGARVVLTSRTSSEIETIQRQIPQQSMAIVADVSSEESVRKLFEEVEKKWGAPDILVNNAGIGRLKNFLEMSVAEWDEILAINLRGSYLCAREAFKRMTTKKSGCIVNVSSLAGVSGTEKFPGFSAYTVSKFGVIGLTEALAAEGRAFGIRVNCVAPGAIDTEMLRKGLPFIEPEAKPEELAEVILYLCDEARSRLLTGATIPIHTNSRRKDV